MDSLHAPWRIEYILSPKPELKTGLFARIAQSSDDEANLGTPKLFTSGKLGMLISGSWAAELLFKNEIKDFEYDAAPMPKLKLGSR